MYKDNTYYIINKNKERQGVVSKYIQTANHRLNTSLLETDAIHVPKFFESQNFN